VRHYLTRLQKRVHNKWRNENDKKFLNLLTKSSQRLTVVDLGCGNGAFTLKVQKRIGCEHIIGVDIYPPSIQASAIRGIRLVTHDLNIFPYPFKDESFDVVVSNQVLEHLFYPVKFLMEVHRILKPHGYCVISTENLASWDNVFALVFGFTPFSVQLDSYFQKLGSISHLERQPIIDMFGKTVDTTCDSHYPHVRVLTYRAIKSLFSCLGFKIIKIVGSGHLLFLDAFQPSRCRFVTVKGEKLNNKKATANVH
jgi:SAM-dependent methyltransferase